MADRIRVDVEQMEEIAVRMRRLSYALDAIEGKIRGVRIDRISGSEVKLHLPSVRLRSTGQSFGSGSAKSCLRSMASALNAVGQHTAESAGRVEQAAGVYLETERWLVSKFEGIGTPDALYLGVCQAMGFHPSQSGWTDEMHKKVQDFIRNAKLVIEEGMSLLVGDNRLLLIGTSGLIASFEQTSSFSNSTFAAKLFNGTQRTEINTEAGLMNGGLNFKDSVLKPGDWGDHFMESRDKDGNLIKDHPGFGDVTGLVSVGVSGSVAHSLWSESVSYESDRLNASVDVGLGNAELSGSLEAGLGIYKPGKDGKMELYAGIDAEAGISVSAINVEASAEYELCDNVSLGVEGEMSALEAEAGFKGKFGIIGNELAAYVEASAEANLVEANVEGSLDIGPIEGKVGASVSVGIGAHAKMGYADGVLTFDMGASLGPGVSINGELNIGGAVDAFADIASDTVDAIGDAAGDVVQAASECWDGVWSFMMGR